MFSLTWKSTGFFQAVLSILASHIPVRMVEGNQRKMIAKQYSCKAVAMPRYKTDAQCAPNRETSHCRLQKGSHWDK